MDPKVKDSPPAPRQQQVVNVRMYNVGFGDCFLVRIPTGSGLRKVLFDCGTIASDRPIREVAEQVIQDATDDDGVPRIDVVVGTHRHKDHVSGFNNPIWNKVQVREVWMPWTENPKDPKARRIRETQGRIAALLERAASTRLTTAAGTDKRELEGLHQLALNALSNEGAMQMLHDGFGGRPIRRFLPVMATSGARDRSFETSALPGVVVHVIGPSFDKDVIRDMEPPIGQSYLRLQEIADGKDADAPDVFNENWWMMPDEYPQSNITLTEDDRQKIKRISTEMEFAVATSLDKAVNGTSLMLMFQIGGMYFLFPGDAQWGTWNTALNDPESRELLKRTDFYKVGHHGSHNATPVEFIQHTIGKNFWAMVSTRSVKQWPNIPRAPLLAAIKDRTVKLARSDQANEAGKEFVVKNDEYIEASIPLSLQAD